MWSLNAATDLITFSIAAKQARDRWTGIAFAPDRKMVSEYQDIMKGERTRGLNANPPARPGAKTLQSKQDVCLALYNVCDAHL